MANKMLIDASHPEETRVVVVRGSRIEEFDFESEHKRQLKGNIYLAKVTRVEPSLQAAFVEYGGNRHGFLAFSEIHPDYYQIPVADRQALIEEELARAAEEDDNEDKPAPKPARSRSRRAPRSSEAKAALATEGESVSEIVEADDEHENEDESRDDSEGDEDQATGGGEPQDDEGAATDQPTLDLDDQTEDNGVEEDREVVAAEDAPAPRDRRRRRGRKSEEPEAKVATDEDGDPIEEVDQIGAEDALEEVPVRHKTPRRQYKIQEVIKRRQILLVQVVKEERGNKGAALTTYLSLAGRYSVLMPNTARGGGISRKITNAADRKRLKDVARELEVPRGMGIILRTAGANRTKAEVKRDYEYLMRLWEAVRTLTLSSTSPALVYEEGSLIKRSIRDLYNKDIDEVLVAGEAGYREAKDFMRMLMPSQAKVVQPYREGTPIFTRQGIEGQLDKMLQPNVTLKSGGYIIINQTEALVAVDVNSGRSTREHSVEDTAYQTNLEAAEEVARQLRLRDLAGLIVIDFIDMEEKRNNRNVEKRLKDCLKDDRARIQLGRISHFGLMEMSRQRIRASVLESTMQTCPVCSGNGFIRSSSSLALHVLRTIEEHLQKHGTHDLIVKVPTSTALYVLNEKRSTIDELERHHGLRITIEAEEGHGHQHVTIEHGAEAVRRPRPEPVQPLVAAAALEAEDAADEAAALAESDALSEDEPVVAEPSAGTATARETRQTGETREEGRRRRRRRRGRRSDEAGEPSEAGEVSAGSDEDVEGENLGEDEGIELVGGEDGEEGAPGDSSGDGRERKRRRRGRRGGRRNREDETGEVPVMDVADGGRYGDGIEIANDDFERTSERSPEPEMTDAVQALDVDYVGESLDHEAENAALAPDENEIMAASAEAGASLDDNRPLDEVYPEADDATLETDEIVRSEAEAADDQPDSATRGPRLTANGSEPEEAEAENKPKRTGWWAKRSFV